jgi:aminoglycoside phosphotransferase (APT) family kinase protein
MHADEVEVDDDLVRGLVRDQFPQWVDLSVRRVPSTGTDNAIYRLGSHLGVRVPRIHWAVGQIAKEILWLPRLAAHLSVALPEPVARGDPGTGYPFPWLVYKWLEGEDALTGPVGEWCALASDTAAFVSELQGIDAASAPPAGYRAGPLAPQDEITRRCIIHLEGVIDVRRATSVWDAALSADPWPGPAVWVHGDLLPGNVLIRKGRLTGIIDWSAAGVGDPACEAMLAWAMPPEARAVYRTELDMDDATWARGRGWALQQAVQFIPYYKETIPDGVAAAMHRLEAILSEDDDARGGRSRG